MSIRSFLYLVARLMGDISAIENGTIEKRIIRRAAGRITGRALGRLLG